MIKDIVKDTEILSQKSERFEFGKDDYLIQDMIDTAEHHKDHCVGLACIQIGIPKRIILVRQNDTFIPFINPIITQKSNQTYTAKEGCLSLDGEKEVKRHKSVKVIYTTKDKKTKCMVFSGFIAEIIQHEIDHLNGILI
jgi:peptide deformylase